MGRDSSHHGVQLGNSSSASQPECGTVARARIHPRLELGPAVCLHSATAEPSQHSGAMEWQKEEKPSSSCTTGLVPGSAAEAQWYQQQLTQIALTAGRKKRSLPVPGTTGLVPGSAAEAQWYQQQLAQIALIAGRK